MAGQIIKCGKRRYTVRIFDGYDEQRKRIYLNKQIHSSQRCPGNSFLLTRFKAATDPEGPPFYFTTLLSDDHLLSPDAVAIPMRLRRAPKNKSNAAQSSFLAEPQGTEDLPRANLSPAARAYLESLGIIDPDADAETSALVWLHALAIGYSSAYLRENADGVRSDWPHIPLPSTKEALLDSAKLGRGIAALLNTEEGVSGVTVQSTR